MDIENLDKAMEHKLALDFLNSRCDEFTKKLNSYNNDNLNSSIKSVIERLINFTSNNESTISADIHSLIKRL